ncbi:MAG: metal-dependent hydrolase [Candidatus Abyssubacteria bacterium]|nr:metal-dependent hydrolase [Candidatus Abyssubacteria bacterium]
MDPVTHLAAGALGGKLAQSRFGKRQLFWFCVTAAWLPDIDNLLGMLGPEGYLLYHRGITHSVFGGLALALMLAGAFRLFSKTFPFREGILIAYACIILHIFLDLITSYGTLIFFPLTRARYTLNSIFIIDPFYTFTMIVFLVAAKRWKNHASRIVLGGLLWVLLYPAAAFGINRALTGYYTARFEREGMSYERIELSTEPFSPFRWKLIVEDESSYHLAGVNTFDPGRELGFETHSKPPPQLIEELGEKVSMLNTFLWFARYPVMRYDNNSEKTRLRFNDMRFYSTLGFLKRRSDGASAPFALVIELDKSGKPLNWQYRRPRGSMVIHYIE